MNYYIYIAIGEQLDKYETFGGEKYYSKAFNIAQIGKSDKHNRDWNKREGKVREYIREEHKNFRAMTAAYYAATYWDEENNEKESEYAANDMLNLLKRIAGDTTEQEFLLKFFAREYQTVGPLLKKRSKDYKVLISIDPEHKSYYDKIFK